MKKISIIFMLCICLGTAVLSIDPTSSSKTSGLYTTKKKLLKMIRLYLIHDRQETESTVTERMKQLQRLPFAQLNTEFEQDPEFMKRYAFLEHVSSFLMRYKGYSEIQANAEIRQIETLSIDQMHQKYYGWCQTLTKNQMLEIMHHHIEFDQGYFGADADREIAELGKLPLSVMRDRFMQYQYTFVTLSNDSNGLNIMDRQQRLQQQFDAQKANRSLLRKVPLVKNVEKLLPAKITNWTDQQLFEKLSVKMKDIGFSQSDVNEEIDRLKNSSITELQKEYPQLERQLSQQLYYFDTAKHQGSDRIKTADFWLQQLHVWGTTAAMIASYGVTAAGYDSSTLDVVAGFALFDPRLTFANGQTKRDLLDMIYAQYSSFDALHDLYINHEYDGSKLLTKVELLQKISDCLNDLGIGAKIRRTQLQKYKNLGKQELQNLYDELNYFVLHQRDMNLSILEKKTLMQTKSELLENIRADLERLKIPKEEIDATINQLEQKNIKLVRTARIDVHDAVIAKPIKLGVIPSFITPQEKVIRNAPKSLAQLALDATSDHIKNSWHSMGKSRAYTEWKISALRDHVAHLPDGTFERLVHAGQVYSLHGALRQGSRIPGISFEGHP